MGGDVLSFWNLNFDDLVMQEEVGIGNFGHVHKADYFGTTVAVKKLNKDPTQDEMILKFIEREVETLK
jgi:serine/threonine protein kinase